MVHESACFPNLLLVECAIIFWGIYKSDGKKYYVGGTSLAVQWLGLRTSTVGGEGAIPGRETRILQAVWCGQKKEKKIVCRYFKFVFLIL